jgi:hypothetical protein
MVVAATAAVVTIAAARAAAGMAVAVGATKEKGVAAVVAVAATATQAATKIHTTGYVPSLLAASLRSCFQLEWKMPRRIHKRI